ncbi:MAG: helix-turn-helix domain-containing protein [Candidatus Accumulibacter sp.]|nr:helix-turn-helix domain-containing protein [Accumulibacter sp.]
MERLYKAAKILQGIEGQTNLAKLLGLSPQTVNNWESRGLSTRGMILAQEEIGCSAVWIKTGKGEMSVENSRTLTLNRPQRGLPYFKDSMVLNQFDTDGGMGSGLILRDQPGIIQSWSVSREWLNKNVKSHTGASNLCIVTGFGDSMKPMFNPGDPLIVDTGINAVEFDAIYFFRVEKEGFIKRLQRIPGQGLRALSANREYESWTIAPDMDFEVFGRVLKVWRSEDF